MFQHLNLIVDFCRDNHLAPARVPQKIMQVSGSETIVLLPEGRKSPAR
jgi:hypothetical protein